MNKIKCPECGSETVTDARCQGCGHTAGNGVVGKDRVKPPPPPEVAGLVITPVPPEIAEEFRRTFSEDEYLAAVRELERTGGHRLETFIDEIERACHGKE